MPSKTQKQARFMAAAAHNPKFAKRVGIKPGVAREFNRADTGTKMLSKAMKRRKKYQYGGLASAGRFAKPLPPTHGGWGGGDPRRMPPPQRFDPNMLPPGKGPRQMVPPSAAGDPRGAMPGQRQAGGMRPGRGALSQYSQARGFPGPSSGRQLPVSGQPGFRGRIPIGNRPNDLLRTAGGSSGLAGTQLNRLMGRFSGAPGRQAFAKGGSVKRAIAALNSARAMLQDSDPDFDQIAALLAKNVPGSSGIAGRIRRTASAKPKTDNPDEFRSAWQAITRDLNKLKSSMGAE